MTIAGGEPSAHAYSEADQERWIPEDGKRPGRSSFARDRARVLHSAGLRRLAAKTQVIAGEDDFLRTRLTHSLECAQIGRELGASFGCDPDLVEAACLSHDLGHPPFGHNGEDALNEIAADIGGFEGNAQSLRLLTRLEAKTFGRDGTPRPDQPAGLNLTRAVLDASTKYPWPRREGTGKFGVYQDDLDVFTWLREGAPADQTCFEAQVMDWADDVAYSVHDLEDAIVSGHLDVRALPGAGRSHDPEGLLDVASWYAADAEAGELSAALDRLVALPWWPVGYGGTLRDLAALKDMTSQLIGRLCTAADEATRAEYGPGRLTRYAANLIVPREQRMEVAVLKAIANLWVMQRAGAEPIYLKQREIIQDLVNALLIDSTRDLDPVFRDLYVDAPDDTSRLRVVVDQVAGLTDRSVLTWINRSEG